MHQADRLSIFSSWLQVCGRYAQSLKDIKMDVEELLNEALEGGLTVKRRGAKLVVRGINACEDLAHRVLSHKAEVMAALDRGQQIIQAMTGDNFEMFAIGFKRLRVTPQPDESRRAALVPLKMAIITILRAETPSPIQAFHDLDEDLVPSDVERKQHASGPTNGDNSKQDDPESVSDVTNADWEAIMGLHATGICPPPCYERCSGHVSYLPPIPDQDDKGSGGGNDTDDTSDG
jgi:hypothetical protein